MPTLRDRTQQQKPVQAKIELPAEFPEIPQEVMDRFPSAADWQKRLSAFWHRTNQALQEAQVQVASQVNSTTVYAPDAFRIYGPDKNAQTMFAVDGTGIRLGSVLVVSTARKTVHIGVGQYQNDNTPFYVDIFGRFSLGANLSWDPDTATLTITGTINADSGVIGGFTIGTDSLTATGISIVNGATPYFQIAGPSITTTMSTTGITLTATGVSVTLGTADITFTNNAGTTGTYGRNGLTLKAATGQPVMTLAIGSTTESVSLTSSASNPIFECKIAAFTTLGVTGVVTLTGGSIVMPANNTFLDFLGGVAATASARLLLFGSTHATLPGQAFLDGDTITFRAADHSTTRATLGATGLTIVGSVTTSAPTTGAAAAWKLGAYTAGAAAQGGTVRVNIGGTDRDLLAV